MIKESVLEGISESGVFGLKVVGVIFVVVGILINVFLGLIIVAKLYGAEIALSITRVIQIIFNALLCTAIIILVVVFVAEILLSLIKCCKKIKEKNKKEFEEFLEDVCSKPYFCIKCGKKIPKEK